MSLFDLKGKSAVVTGSTRGIGKATARQLAAQGANVIVCGRSADAANKVAEEINDTVKAKRATGAAFDLAGPIEPLLNLAMERHGRLDIMVSNAAQTDVGGVRNLEDDVLMNSFRLNVLQNVKIGNAAAPLMARTGGGSIVFVTSIVAFYVNPGVAAYSLAKAALHHLVGFLAMQYAGQSVRVNAVAPGLILTDSSQFMADDREHFPKFTAQLPMHRIGQPDELAGAVVFMSSPAASYVTGQILAVDGGAMLAGTQAMSDSLMSFA
jgi:NAD(P)-dependent dehydrogenase (short-subunit alcohol dehydrogenase family)